MKSKLFLALLLSVCVFLPAFAQTKPTTITQPQKATDDKDDVVRITTNLVQIDVSVTKDGKVVPNLNADDFEIYEDGRKQTITSFAYISNAATTTDQPVTQAKAKTNDAVPISPLKRDVPRRIMALVVDDLGLSAESMGPVKKQLRKFIAEQMQPNDLVAIMRTGSELGALQQFTNDKRLLNRAVDLLRWNVCSRVGPTVLPSLQSFILSDNTELGCRRTSYLQTINALRFILDSMGQLPGRKSLVLLSDSVPVESQEINSIGEGSVLPASFTNYSLMLQRLAEKAIRSSVVIYAVDTQGLQYTGFTAADAPPTTLQNMIRMTPELMSSRSNLLYSRRYGGDLIAKQTGGFQVRNSNSFGLDRIVEDQSGYYLLGYRPTEETFNRRFHHIKAKVKPSGMTVRTRFGFFGVSEEEAPSTQQQYRNAANLALMSPFGEQGIELNLTSFFTHDKAAGAVIRSFVNIDPRELTFETSNGLRQALIEFHGAVFGDNGVVAEQFSRRGTVSLTETEYEEAMRSGKVVRIDIPVKKPGFYQVRIAARDRTSSKIGSAGQFVDVPDLNKKRLAVSGVVLGTMAESSSHNVDEGVERPGVRKFARNSNLHFVFTTYNAAGAGSLVMGARLFRDGKMVYAGPDTPIEVGNQPDLVVNGSIPLSPELEVGNYYLQVVIADKSVKKPVPVVQWIDFEIVK